MTRRFFSRLAVVATAAGAAGAAGAPAESSFGVGGEARAERVSAAALGGWYASSETAGDSVTIRDVRGAVVRTISRGQIAALAPWMALSDGPDGPTALAFTDSGRLLFIAVHDANPGPQGHATGDAILRLDTHTGDLTLFHRWSLSLDDAAVRSALAHFRGRLYAATPAGLLVLAASANTTVSMLLHSGPAPAPIANPSVTIDRESAIIYHGGDDVLRRAPVPAAGTTPPSFATVATVPGLKDLAFGDAAHGAPASGLLLLTQQPGAAATIGFVPAAIARSSGALAPVIYATAPASLDIAATADGGILAARESGAAIIRDTADTRLAYQAFLADEFAQVVAFAKGLISPDGEPAGWVIDADVQLGWTRFHPATPDGAAWTLHLLMMSERVNGDAAARGLARTILARYAGRLPGPAPSRTADGIFRHWIDPLTGQAKPGWDPEFATMSTMKLVHAAARAAAFWPQDPEIVASAREIVCGVGNWDAYFDGANRMSLKGASSGGGLAGSESAGWHEGVLFAEQAGVYGGPRGDSAASAWTRRTTWPTSLYLANRPVTTAGFGFQPAFITLYAQLLIGGFRTDPMWGGHVANLRASHAAWNDDVGPRWATVFSAGTTKPEWGGYRADSLSSFTGNVAHFPALLGTAAGMAPAGAPGVNREAELVGAYHAYRTGARQTFRSGASILYRRSSVDPAYQPNSAGLPDVAMGGLALADVLSPGAIDDVLTGPYPSCAPACSVADVVSIGGFPPADGELTVDDYTSFINAFAGDELLADIVSIGGFPPPDGELTVDDYTSFINAFADGCGV